MKKFLYIVLALIIILFAGVFIAAKFIPIEKIQAEALKQAKDQTGLDITIDGTASLSVFPSIALEAPKVTIKKPNESKQLASVESLNLVISLSDLIFSQQVRVERLDLISPDLYLEKKKEGTLNWSIDTASASKSNNDTDKKKEGSVSPAAAALFVNQVKIKDGKLTYVDASKNKTEVIDHLNFDLEMPSLSSTLKAEADFMLHGQKTDFNITLKKANALYEKEASDLSMSLENNVMRMTFNGTGQSLISDARELKGDYDFETKDLPALLQWTSGAAEKPSSSFTKVSKKGKIQLAQNTLSVNPLQIEVDEYKGEGSATIALGTSKPNAKVNLSFNNIAIDRMVAEATTDTNLTTATLQELFLSKVALADSDDDKIDLSALDTLDGTFKIGITNLSLKGESLGQTNIDATLSGGRLNSQLVQSNLFKGKADIKSVLTSNGNYSVNWGLDDVDVNPLLTLFKDFKKLNGTADSNGSVTMAGTTKKQLKQSMSGSGAFNIQNGSIQGIDLGAIGRDITKLFSQSNAKTEFSSLTMTFQANNGRINTNDLAMKSPMVQLSGNGYVDLPSESVNIRIVPKFADTSKASQGKLNLASLTIPFIVSGTFDHLTVLPDAKGIIEESLKNPEALGNQINNLLGKKGGKKGAATQDIINGILGGGSSSAPSQAPEGEPSQAPSQDQPAQKNNSNPGAILNQLLGQ